MIVTSQGQAIVPASRPETQPATQHIIQHTHASIVEVLMHAVPGSCTSRHVTLSAQHNTATNARQQHQRQHTVHSAHRQRALNICVCTVRHMFCRVSTMTNMCMRTTAIMQDSHNTTAAATGAGACQADCQNKARQPTMPQCASTSQQPPCQPQPDC
jgi:hypothetical protein